MPDSTEFLPKNLYWDKPEYILEESIDAQKHLLEGYYGILNRVDRKRLEEAHSPTNVAISLTGDPTFYPEISELIDYYKKKHFSTFLVTNGMLPKVVEEMHLPHQLYISVDAPDEKTQRKIDLPLISDAWERLNKTLEILPSLDTRRVIRITLVKDWNDIAPEEYAKLVERSEADFLEVKGYVYVGGSRQRMFPSNMPSHQDVKNFSFEIERHLGYDIIDEKMDSRVVLLSSGKKKARVFNR